MQFHFEMMLTSGFWWLCRLRPSETGSLTIIETRQYIQVGRHS